MVMEYTAITPSLSMLRARLAGRLIFPNEADYDQARLAWNRAVQQRPLAIAVAANAQDVAAAVRFAREQGLQIAVQSTGHGVIRAADDRLLIVTSQLSGLEIDPAAQTARIEAGLKWGTVLAEAQRHGLAPLLGSSATVGVVGYTLGGGMGWLARKYGLAADSVLAYELVSAQGELLRAAPDENANLFWALRTGGANFGIVTAMEIQLYPVAHVYGGTLIYPASEARAVLTRYRDWIANAPDELTSSVAIMNMPPLPHLPPFLSGQTVVMVHGCYAGSEAEGAALVQAWRDWQTPVADDFRWMPFTEVASISNDPVDPMPALSTGAWLRDLSDETVDLLLQYGLRHEGMPPLIKTEIRHAGGTMARSAAADARRQEELVLQFVGLAPSPEAYGALGNYTAQAKAALEGHLSGVYLNFLEGEESRERTQEAFTPEALAALATAKQSHDPDDLFDFSFAVRGS